MKISKFLTSTYLQSVSKTTQRVSLKLPLQSTKVFFSSKLQKDSLAGKRILVAGCKGQIGIPLVRALCKEVGAENVIAADIGSKKVEFACREETLDVTDFKAYHSLVKNNNINYVVHLAAILSALGEKFPDRAMDVNMNGCMNALNIAREFNCQLYVPSTIAVFGGNHFNKHNTPLNSVLQPTTVYGATKVYNELIGTYYFNKYGVDFRSIRYPGIISSEKYDFNGTTDYSTEIFFAALENKYYKCWLDQNTALPMMYIDDCIDFTVKFMKADSFSLRNRVYNMAGISFTPKQLAQSIQKMIPGFKVEYEPDFRQAIANSWPKSIDDHESREDWGLTYDITVDELAEKILNGIEKKYKQGVEIRKIETPSASLRMK